MGKSYTPKYRVELRENSAPPRWNAMTWQVKTHGKTTVKNLEKFVERLNKSYQLGGVNEHVSKEYGFIIHAFSARIIKQSTGEIVAEYSAPMFQVF